MPNRDKTGPNGEGALTGRGLGNCDGARREFGRNLGFGCGRRCGWNFGRAGALTKDEERKFLEAELTELELEKKEIEKRLKE